VVELEAFVVVVGVIEAVAALHHGLGAEDGVVEDSLHAVAVAGVARDAEEVAGDFEHGVCAAGGFETGVSFSQAVAESAAARSAESFVGTPAAGGEALRAKPC